MLCLEEIILGQCYGILVYFHCNGDDIITLVETLVFEQLELVNVFLVMNG